VIAGVVMKLFMFCLRLSHSGKAVHVAYANQTQESFLDGHVRAFAALGGIPVGMIRYDNLRPAVIRVALGRDGSSIPGSSRCARTTATTRSSAPRASRARMRRAESRARSAGSDAGT
jgi:transposase